MSKRATMIACMTGGVALACLGVAAVQTSSEKPGGMIQQVNEASPAGVIAAFGGVEAPAGWYLCNGDALDSKKNPQYAKLYAAIKTNFGGTGPTDFKVPDLRGQFLRGFDTTTKRDPKRVFGSSQEDTTRQPRNTPFSLTKATGAGSGKAHAAGGHSHEWTYPYETREGGNGTASILFDDGNLGDKSISTSAAGVHEHDVTVTVSVDGVISGGDSETRPVNVAVNFIIKF